MARTLHVALVLVCLALGAAAGCGSGGSGDAGPTPTPTPSPGPTPGFEDALGFVVSSFGFVFPTHGDEVACPDGFNRGPIEMRAAGEEPLPDDCLDPQANLDPGFRPMAAPGALDGFDLDGRVSTATQPAADECAHDDFSGPGGELGYDNQLWRALGCIRGFQPGDAVAGVVDAAVRDGSMTILVDVRGVDDPRNDSEVEVQLFSSRDAPPLGADGSVLPFGTLGIDPDARYHGSVAAGRIENGILVAGPMDLRLRLNIQIVVGDLTFEDAYVRVILDPDGSATGAIHGYTPIEDVYEVFGRQAGTIGGKEALGYTCSGLHAALVSQADGGFDPATQSCSSLSAAYRFAAAPAFVAR